MSDQIVDTVMASAVQADAARVHPLLAWVVTKDPPEDPAAAFVARLVTAGPTPYVLVAASHDQLLVGQAGSPAGAAQDVGD